MSKSRYQQYMEMSLEEVQRIVDNEPNNIPVGNAVRQLIAAKKTEWSLMKLGERSSRTDGMTKTHRPFKGGRRCPTKHELG